MCSNRFIVAAVLLLLQQTSASAHPLPQEAEPPWRGSYRAWVLLRPLFGISQVGWQSSAPESLLFGMIGDLGVEANTRLGLLIGAELAPLTWYLERPQIAARFRLGYTNQRLAVGVSLANAGTWIYPQLGLGARMGRLERSYVLVRIGWSTYPPRPLPADFYLEVNAVLDRKRRLNLQLGGNYADLISLYGTAGLQIFLRGSGGAGTSILVAGAGVSWFLYYLGPMFVFGYEARL